MDRPATHFFPLGWRYRPFPKCVAFFKFFEKCGMNVIQKLMVLNGLLYIILYRYFEKLENYKFLFMRPGEVYKSGNVKQSE